MKGTLYLGRISDFKEYNDKDIKCFSISRSDAFGKYMEELKGLAPSWDLLSWHRMNKNRKVFREGYYPRYFEQVKNSEDAQDDIRKVSDMLNEGQDVAFICFCVNHIDCHRGILGEWFEKKGYNVVYK